jgi:glycine oxidase
MLSPQAEADRADAFLSLLLESRNMYPQFAAQLQAETGIDVAYRDDGTLLVALTAEDERELDERYRWQVADGLSVERLDGEAARSAEPALNRCVRGALRFPDDHQVDNRALARALWAAAQAAGVEMRGGIDAARVVRVQGRVGGVELTNGELLAAESVVVAAGARAGQLGGLPGPLPVVPVHGQLLALEQPSPLFRHVVDSPRGYLVPRAGARLIVGATVEQIGFRRAVTVEGVQSLLAAAVEIAPGLAASTVAELWSGHRPGTPDHRPILGVDPRLPGLVYATGHYRNGILLAPITGRIVADLILGGATTRDLSSFSIERFFTAEDAEGGAEAAEEQQ